MTEHAHQYTTNGDRYRCPARRCWWTATGIQALHGPRPAVSCLVRQSGPGEAAYWASFETEDGMRQAIGTLRAEGALVLGYRADGEPAQDCPRHGIVDLEHSCPRGGESAMEFTDRMLGYTRDV